MIAVIGLVVVGIAIVVFTQVGLEGLIVALVGGGVGFAIGSLAAFGWSIFGAILGGLIGFYLVHKQRA